MKDQNKRDKRLLKMDIEIAHCSMDTRESRKYFKRLLKKFTKDCLKILKRLLKYCKRFLKIARE